MENKFLDRVSDLIQNKTTRQSITAELESHILDKADYYEEIGYSKEVAIQKATEEMGSPDDTAVPLNALHKNGKSKNLWSIITAVFAVAFSLLCFNVIPIEHLFRYGDASFSIVHSVTFDFLSMLICGAFLILLCKAYRQKNIVSSSLLVLSLIATAFAYFPDFTHPAFQFSPFQPFLYPAVMILKNGFTDFADSLFGYSYIPDSEQIFYHIGAVVIYLILLAVAVTLLIAIYRQSRMKTARRLWIPIKIAKPVLGIVLAVSLLVMSITTVFALINIEDKQLEMQSAREKAIDFVINADVWGTDEQLKDDLLNAGYESYYSDGNIWQSVQKTYHNGYNDSAIMTIDLGGINLFYGRTDLDRSFILAEDSGFITADEQEQMESGMTLDEFLQLGFYTKAMSVSHFGDVFEFTFRLEEKYFDILNNEHYKSINYRFEWNLNGNDYYLISSRLMPSETEKKMSGGIEIEQEVTEAMPPMVDEPEYEQPKYEEPPFVEEPDDGQEIFNERPTDYIY